MSNKKPPPVVVGLQTLDMKADIQQPNKSLPIRAMKKRVFTDEQWAFLQTLQDVTLIKKIHQGRYIINLLHRPEMLNMTPPEAAYVSSNLNYQIDAIKTILRSRGIEIVENTERSK